VSPASLRPTSAASNRRVNALEFIRRYFVERGASPSLKEIGDAIGTSPQAACGIVHILAKRGDILLGEGRRSIRLPDRAEELSDSELVLLARRRGLLVIRDGRVEPATG
jgi:SOS-response transcriptional repressor LexA